MLNREEHEGILSLLFRRVANIYRYDISQLPSNDLEIVEGCVFYDTGDDDTWKPIRMIERGEEGFLCIMGLWCVASTEYFGQRYSQDEDQILADNHVFGLRPSRRMELTVLGKKWIQKLEKQK